MKYDALNQMKQFDNTRHLTVQVAELYNIPATNTNRISELMKQAKSALGLSIGARRISIDDQQRIFEWHNNRINQGQIDVFEELEPIVATVISPLVVEPEPVKVDIVESKQIPAQPIPPNINELINQAVAAALEKTRNKNLGGKREGAGRKPSSIKTVSIRVDDRLLPAIKRLKELFTSGVDVMGLLNHE